MKDKNPKDVDLKQQNLKLKDELSYANQLIIRLSKEVDKLKQRANESPPKRS